MILEETDMLITSGGVSVGDFDIMVEVFNRLDAQLLFNKIAMRPGSVTSAARYNDQFIFGLSGNPGACFVGFELFVRPLLAAMQGKPEVHLPETKAILGVDMKKPSPFDRFVRSSWAIEDGRVVVYPVGRDKSGVVTNITDANCLMRIPPGEAELPKVKRLRFYSFRIMSENKYRREKYVTGRQASACTASRRLF